MQKMKTNERESDGSKDPRWTPVYLGTAPDRWAKTLETGA